MAGLVVGGPIDLHHLPWLVYSYGSDGFAWEHPMGRNLNVIGYPFPQGTQSASFLYLYPFHFLLCIP